MPDEPTDREEPVDLDEGDRFHDLDLGTPGPPGEDTPTPARGGLLPAVLAGLAVVAGGLLLAMIFLFRTPAASRPPAAPTASPAAPPGATTATPAPPPPPLPALDESDGLARTLGASLSAHPELARWLAQRDLVRRLAAAVTNVANGDSPRPHLAFLAPARPFAARSARGRLVADPAAFQAYDAFGDAVASVNAAAAVSAYRTLEPLFDAARRELGEPEGRFRDTLDRAIAALLAVPVLPDDAALVRHATLLRYADPALEALTPAQKQLLRTGPRNVALVQAKLREVQAALAAAPTAP